MDTRREISTVLIFRYSPNLNFAEIIEADGTVSEISAALMATMRQRVRSRLDGDGIETEDFRLCYFIGDFRMALFNGMSHSLCLLASTECYMIAI
jgi:hypothetical protein